MKSLELFNAVVAQPSNEMPFVSTDGYIVMPNALYAKAEIAKHWRQSKLSGNDLNKTFHKSWEKIANSSRLELFIEQIMHYASTYGSNFEGEMYIPDEVLDVPDVKIPFKIFRGYTKDELIEKSLAMLKSGIALKEDTVNDLLEILVSDLDYTFTGSEGIRNKEAIIKIADTYGVIPQDTMEFFRYVIYRMTNETLLIKSPGMIHKIKESGFNPTPQFKAHGLEKLAEIFNRFKPLFLAMKPKHAKVINKISKLSKTYHKPLVSNPLNMVTSVTLTDSDTHWLDNATPYALFKAMSACHTRMNGQSSFVYRIRNGKSWATESEIVKSSVAEANFYFLTDYMSKRFDMSGKKFFLPEDVSFALPTSEKMYVGNIPTGSKFFGEQLAVGIYWRNDWGARDHDLSGMSALGKVGWNARYSGRDGGLLYSGDITNAPNGAVEYLHARNKFDEPTIVMNNIYSGGSEDTGYKIIVGQGNDIDRKYMMDPNNLLMEVKTETVQRQMVLGLFLPEDNGQSFVILNFGAGSTQVSGYGETARIATQALYEQWRDPLMFNDLIALLGGEIVDNQLDADYNFSLDKLERDSFTKVFE